MCRNIKILFNFDPPVTDEEIRNASLQFVRKISGFTKPSQTNQPQFEAAVDEQQLSGHLGVLRAGSPGEQGGELFRPAGIGAAQRDHRAHLRPPVRV